MFKTIRNIYLKLYKYCRFKIIGKRVVYLSGPMESVVDTCHIWRNEAKELIKIYPIEIIDPVHNEKEKIGMNIKTAMSKLHGWKRSGKRKLFTKTVKKIKALDLWAVKTSDFIICYWNNDIRTVGTISELDWAEEFEVPVYVFTPNNISSLNSWLLFDILSSGGDVTHRLIDIITNALDDFDLLDEDKINE